MAEKIFEGVFYVEDIKRRHLQNGDKLRVVLEAPWELEEHQEILPSLGRMCNVGIDVRPDAQSELDLEE